MEVKSGWCQAPWRTVCRFPHRVLAELPERGRPVRLPKGRGRGGWIPHAKPAKFAKVFDRINMIYKILRLFEYCQNTGRKDAVVSDTCQTPRRKCLSPVGRQLRRMPCPILKNQQFIVQYQPWKKSERKRLGRSFHTLLRMIVRMI